MYIEKLTGRYDTQLPNGIVLDVGGVGYGMEMPLSALCQLPKLGETLTVWTMTHVREDAIRLFGFIDYEDRVAFEVMLGLSGVGPKVALAILSTLSIAAIRRAIQFSDTNILTSVPGVGPRLAEKLLVDLRPKLERLSPHPAIIVGDSGNFDVNPLGAGDTEVGKDGQQQILDDVTSALENLGFKAKLIAPIIKKVRHSGFTSFQDAMKEALNQINGRSEGVASMTATTRSERQLKVDQQLF